MPDKIAVHAIVNRARSDVWRLFNDPQHITQWNFATDDWCCPRAENDLRVGGRLCSRMEARDGSFGFDFEAIYDAVVAESRLVYTMTDGRQAETRFEALAGATKVTTEFDPETANPVALQRDGWQAILNNFKSYAESA